MRRKLCISLATILTLAYATPAHADATAFIGTNTTPTNRSVRGFALGVGLLIVGFEFEYANTTSDDRSIAPSLKTGSGNVLFQTPVPVLGFQPYFTAGMGVYRERTDVLVDTSVMTNMGGGVKVSLAGPVRLRVDYRVLRLGSGRSSHRPIGFTRASISNSSRADQSLVDSHQSVNDQRLSTTIDYFARS